MLDHLDAGGTAPLAHIYGERVSIHGREFQRYAISNGIYFEPVDEQEIDRQSLLHAVLMTAFDKRLIFPPMPSPRRILDCGCGAGYWVMEAADRYPSCQIVGVDISPSMIPEDPPPNVDFQIDDLNQSFTFQSNSFDLVHSQIMAGGIHTERWPQYLKDIHRVLRPGGWCQMVEIYPNAQSDNGTLTSDHALSRWSRLYLDGVSRCKDPRAAINLDSLMRNAGFIKVAKTLVQLPITTWPQDQREQDIGRQNMEQVRQMMFSMGVYPMTEFLNMPLSQVQVLVAQAFSEAIKPQLKAYFPMYVCIGQKAH